VIVWHPRSHHIRWRQRHAASRTRLVRRSRLGSCCVHIALMHITIIRPVSPVSTHPQSPTISTHIHSHQLLPRSLAASSPQIQKKKETHHRHSSPCLAHLTHLVSPGSHLTFFSLQLLQAFARRFLGRPARVSPQSGLTTSPPTEVSQMVPSS